MQKSHKNQKVEDSEQYINIKKRLLKWFHLFISSDTHTHTHTRARARARVLFPYRR